METMLLADRRIFIVEDNLENRAIMQMLLEQHGAKIGLDRWGIDTINRLVAFMPVDVILMDLMLPNNTNGFEIFQKIRADGRFNDLPIVAVSAMDASVALSRVMSYGFAGLIGKPIDFDRFPRQVADAINTGSLWTRRT